MRFLIALIAVSPVAGFAISVLWDEFRHEVVTGYDNVTFKVESKKTRNLIELEFPLVVELFAILLAGNQSPATALDHISRRTHGEFSFVLRDAVNEIHQGANFSQALDLLSARIQSPMVRRFCDSLMIAVERGSPLIDVVNRQVEEVRNEQRSRLLEAAGKAEIALMIPVVFLILPISVLFALWPSYFALGRSAGF
jgi:tight adherence protein C